MPPTEPNADILQFAHAVHEFYVSLKRAGFPAEETLYLTGCMVRSMVQNGQK